MPLSGPPLNAPVDLPKVLSRGLETMADELALVSAETRWTWRQLEETSGRLARNLLGLGLKPGDRVASLMPNRDLLVIHYLGCLKAGLVITPLNYRYKAPEIDHALQVSTPKALLAHAEREADLSASERVSRLPLGVISYDAEDGRSPRLEALLDAPPPDLALPAPSASDPAVIFFTSGSTGKPKGVTHSFETLGWTLACYAKGIGMGPQDLLLPGSSLSHGGAFNMSLAGLATGARVDVAKNHDADEILPLLRQTRPTVIWMLPSALFALVRDHGASRGDFSSIRYCGCGGDKVAGELEKEFTALTGLEIREAYGMTELGNVAINPPSGLNKPGSIGRPAPGVSLSIRDVQGAELPAGQEGNLWVKSPSAMIGYWNNNTATAAAMKDGWFDSGDILRADDDGYLWFRSRKKQIIVHDGSNISPQEVEEALLEHSAVESAGVIGIHDLMHGENVRAYVTLRTDAPRPTGQELIAFARARIGYKAPEVIEMLDAMPFTATGKVDRTALKKMAADQLNAAHAG